MFFLKHTTRVQMLDGYEILADAAIDEESMVIDSGAYEPEIMEQCRPWITPQAVCLDVGAGIGFFACFFAALIDPEAGGQVHAFEPVPRFHKRLLKNIRINGFQQRVTVYQQALGRQSGTLKLHIIPHTKTNNAVGENRIAGHHRIEFRRARGKATVAPLTTLDAWSRATRPGRVDLMKLDVEGGELDVLHGAHELLAMHRPVIVGEFNPYWMAQTHHGFQDVMNLVSPMKYGCFRLVGQDLFPMRADLIARYPEVPTYVLIPEEKLGLKS